MSNRSRLFALVAMGALVLLAAGGVSPAAATHGDTDNVADASVIEVDGNDNEIKIGGDVHALAEGDGSSVITVTGDGNTVVIKGNVVVEAQSTDSDDAPTDVDEDESGADDTDPDCGTDDSDTDDGTNDDTDDSDDSDANDGNDDGTDDSDADDGTDDSDDSDADDGTDDSDADNGTDADDVDLLLQFFLQQEFIDQDEVNMAIENSTIENSTIVSSIVNDDLTIDRNSQYVDNSTTVIDNSTTITEISNETDNSTTNIDNSTTVTDNSTTIINETIINIIGDADDDPDDGNVTDPGDDDNVTDPGDDGNVTDPGDDDNVTDPDESGTIDISECRNALVSGNVTNATVELDLLNLETGETETVTVGPTDANATVSADELDDIASIGLDAAVIEEARLVDSDGTVLDTDTNTNLGACVEVLGIEVADLDTDLFLDADVLEQIDDPDATVLANLLVELDDTQIQLLNEAIDTGEITNEEVIDLAEAFDSNEVTLDEIDALLNNSLGQLGDALDSLLDQGVLPGLTSATSQALAI